MPQNLGGVVMLQALGGTCIDGGAELTSWDQWNSHSVSGLPHSGSLSPRVSTSTAGMFLILESVKRSG